MNNKQNHGLVPWKEIPTLLGIERYKLFEIIRSYKLEEFMIGVQKYYSEEDVNRLRDLIHEKYNFNKQYRMTRHQILALGGTQRDLDLIKMYKTEMIDRVFEYSETRYIYDKEEALKRVYLRNTDIELIHQKEIKKRLNMTDIRQTKKLLNDYNIFPVETGNKNYKMYSLSEIDDLALLINERYLYNKENYFTNKEVTKLGLSESEITQLKVKMLEPIDRVKEFSGIYCFYNKKEVNEKANFKRLKSDGLMLRKEIMELLGFNNMEKLKMVLEKYNLPKISNGSRISYYKKEDVLQLSKIVKERYEKNKKSKLTYQQIIDLGGSPHDVASIKSYRTEPIDNVFEFSKVNMFYDKTELQKRLYQKFLQLESYSNSEVIKLLDHKNPKAYLISCNIFPLKIFGQNHWKKDEIDSLVLNRTSLYKDFEENYFTINEAQKILREKNKTSLSNINFEDLHTLLPLEVRYNKFSKISKVVLKEDIYHLSELLSKEELKQLEAEKAKALEKKLKLLKKNLIDSRKIRSKNKEREQLGNIGTYQSDTKLQLLKEQIINITEINVDTIIRELESYSFSNVDSLSVIRRKDLTKKYGHTLHFWDRLISENKIKPFIFHNTSFFLQENIEKILKDLTDQQENILKSHYTFNQFIEIGGTRNMLLEISKLMIPQHLRFGIFQRSHTVYDKGMCDQCLEEKNYLHLLEDLKDSLNSQLPNNVFLKAINSLNIEFSNNAIKTQQLWLDYVCNKLLSINGSNENLQRLFKRFINITKVLNDHLTDSELYLLTAAEINLRFLNSSKINKSNKTEIYIFLKYLDKKIKVNYRFEKLTNIHQTNRLSRKSKKRSSYSPDTFLKLINYVSNIDLHKKNALNEITLENKKIKYWAYESAWAYVILHLNNGWRSSDFVDKIPRISLPDSVKDFNSFSEHDLTTEESERIIWELTSKLVNIQHSKNDKKSYFFCSDSLKKPLANALVLCELKNRQERPLSNSLIHLTKNKELGTSLNNRFFHQFEIANFQFGSLAANRSLLTFVNQIIHKKTNRNPLEITKFIRNHSSIETTNGYVQITETHLNKVSNELFEKGNFGYTYEYLLKSILKIDQTNEFEIIDTHIIKDIFGDIYKVENFATYINYINKNYKSLYSFVDNLKDEEKKDLVNLIDLRQLPAKEEFYQCILGNCMYLNRQCNTCPFAIPHFFILTKTTDNLLKTIKTLEENDDLIYGEKVRLVNLLYKNLVILSSAKKKFGENTLASFLGQNYSDFIDQVNSLEDIYKILTIERRK